MVQAGRTPGNYDYLRSFLAAEYPNKQILQVLYPMEASALILLLFTYPSPFIFCLSLLEQKSQSAARVGGTEADQQERCFCLCLLGEILLECLS